MFVVYIIYSRSLQKYYTGQTNDIENRLFRHNAGHEKYSKVGIPWELVWKQEVDTRSEAMILENRIKKRGAERYIKALKVLF
jgi:putative endonuclease